MPLAQRKLAVVDLVAEHSLERARQRADILVVGSMRPFARVVCVNVALTSLHPLLRPRLLDPPSTWQTRGPSARSSWLRAGLDPLRDAHIAG